MVSAYVRTALRDAIKKEKRRTRGFVIGNDHTVDMSFDLIPKPKTKRAKRRLKKQEKKNDTV